MEEENVEVDQMMNGNEDAPLAGGAAMIGNQVSYQR